MFPPDYFEGQSAPQKTSALAAQLMVEGIYEAWAGDLIPVLDGQPREPSQVRQIRDIIIDPSTGMVSYSAIMLWAPESVRRDRAAKRDTGDALKLSLARMDSEVKPLLDCWAMISSDPALRAHTAIFDTTVRLPSESDLFKVVYNEHS